jgi:hypothetical protein
VLINYCFDSLRLILIIIATNTMNAATLEMMQVILVVVSSRLKYFGSPPSDHPKRPSAKNRKISAKKVKIAPPAARITESNPRQMFLLFPVSAFMV